MAVDTLESKENKLKENDKLKDRNEFIIRIFSISFVIFLFIVLFFIKKNNPNFPFWGILIIAIIVLALGLSAFFFFKIIDYFQDREQKDKNKNSLPAPASHAELLRIVEECMVDKYYCNHIRRIKNTYYQFIGKINKSRIFVAEIEPLYDDEINLKKTEIVIIINTHYPLDLRSILVNPTATELTKAIHSLAVDPEPEMEEKIIERSNPLLGTNEKIIEKVKPKENDEKKEEVKKGEIE